MAGIDTENQFPNSMMANAVKLGQSRIFSGDVPDIQMGQQPNVVVTNVAGTALTVPTAVGTTPNKATLQPTYAVVTADGGPLYYTIDGTAPSAANYAGKVAQDSAIPFYGLGLLKALLFFGTAMSVAYYR